VSGSVPRPGWWLPDAVEVAGLRSLAKATAVVGALLVRRGLALARRVR